MSIPPSVTPAEAVACLAHRLPEGGRVFVPGCAAEPLLLAEAYAADPDAAAKLTFLGVWIPGVNRTDWAGLHPGARGESIFLSPDWRSSFERGDFAFRPLSYTQAWPWLGETPLDAALFQVSAPDAGGLCSLGLAADFSPAVLPRDLFRVAHVNPLMPAPAGAPKVRLDEFDLVVEAAHPVLIYDAGVLDEGVRTLAARVAELIPEGAHVQFGLGKAGVAVLEALAGHRRLSVHSGMVTDPLVAALDSGAVEQVTTGAALGSEALYARVAEDRRITFREVGFTHDIRTLAGLARFTAVNSVIEVDLFGQANAEFINGRQVSAAGGLVDFLRGARLSPGGTPILALNATAKGGSLSRIVPRLEPNAVSIARADVGVVVTEHGAADLRGLDLDARAQTLIGIAAPAHRDTLSDTWDRMRRSM